MTWHQVKVWLAAYRPRPITWLRTHLVAPRVVTFSDRWPLIIVVLLALTLGGVAINRVDRGDAARARRACASYAADAIAYRSQLWIDGQFATLSLSPSQRAGLARAIRDTQGALRAKEQLRRDLRCPDPSPAKARTAP